MAGGDSSGTDPRRLEGRSEDSRPRDFFWDSISLYVVGVILALTVVDVTTEFLRGSTISCLFTNDDKPQVTEAFVNSYCSSSLPGTEFFPAYIAVHAILIAIPHYLWANHYGGNFEFFFSQARNLDRMRDEETGTYSDKNYIIVRQLTQAFTTYNQNWMYILYVLKLAAQTSLSLAGFLVAVFYFTDFNDVYMCPKNLMINGTNSDRHWPLDDQATCIFTSMRLFSTLRVGYLILLALLMLCFMWAVIWCFTSHQNELGTDKVATFSFLSSISPRYYIPRGTFLPYIIANNLDFLVLKLFRTDSGLGFVFKEMQVLDKIKVLNDDDQRRATLHRWQQNTQILEDGGES